MRRRRKKKRRKRNSYDDGKTGTGFGNMNPDVSVNK
jgi:hypothetical protein